VYELQACVHCAWWLKQPLSIIVQSLLRVREDLLHIYELKLLTPARAKQPARLLSLNRVLHSSPAVIEGATLLVDILQIADNVKRTMQPQAVQSLAFQECRVDAVNGIKHAISVEHTMMLVL